MRPSNHKAQVTETTVGRAMRAITLETDLLSTTVVLDQGADIHTLIYKPKGVDALWKSPLPVREPGVGPTPVGDSLILWRSYYRGGWQTIFPNFGPDVVYRGAPLDWHGEAARTVWQLDSLENDGQRIVAILGVELLKSPFRIRRVMSLDVGQPTLSIAETITNEGPEAMDCVWGHHPAFGPPLLSPDSFIDTGARTMVSDDVSGSPGNDLFPGQTWEWPVARGRRGEAIDLAQVPGPGSGRSRVVYLKDFAHNWCALTNPTLQLGVGLVWSDGLLPYVALWQETGGTQGYPWYGRANVIALEPISSYPADGLTAIMEKTGTQLVIGSGESRTLELKAIFYEGQRRVARIHPDGSVTRR